MPAMHDDVYEHACRQLVTMRDRMQRLIPFNMTHEECINLVAPSEHVQVLVNAAKYANISASEAWFVVQVPAVIDGANSPEVQLLMRTHGEKLPPLIPRYPYWQLDQAGEKVIEWLTKRFELGRKFGTVQRVLRVLNRECETGQQLRYMFPAVLQLCKMGLHPRMDRWMTKNAAYRPCRHTPAVSPRLKQAIQDSSALLTSAMLIGEDIPERTPGEVDIMEYQMPTFQFGDEGSESRI